MLKYKCENAGVWFEEVNEAYIYPDLLVLQTNTSQQSER